MKTLTRGLIAVGLCIIVLGFCTTSLFSGTNALSNAATTVLLQNGSLTQQVETALLDNDEFIAQQLGVSAAEVEQNIGTVSHHVYPGSMWNGSPDFSRCDSAGVISETNHSSKRIAALPEKE